MTSVRGRLGLPNLGDGVGLRDVHFRYLLNTPAEVWGVDWFEIISENFFDDHGFAAHVLDHVAAHRPVVMHGVSLSIGGTDPLDTLYLRKLRTLAERVRPAWVSDHLCWTGVNGVTSHDLLPMPLTRHSLAHVADRVRVVQDYLGRPLVLENPSTYLEFCVSEIPEWEFLAMLAQETGCGLLLDVNNVYVGAFNHGFDPVTYIEGLPAEHIVQVHLAGPRDHGTHLLDTHDQPVPEKVWPLYALAQHRTGGVATLLEWDADIPPFPELVAELAKAKAARADRVVEQPTELPLGGGDSARWSVPGTGWAGPNLSALQGWMLAACTSAVGVVEGFRRNDPGYGLAAAAAVRACHRRSAETSLDIYARGYLARLLECLRAEFPVLRAMVGDQVFDLFARAYVADHPPRSPSLFDLGAGFAGYLEETRPKPVGHPDASDALPAALARLERSRREAGQARGVETDPDHCPLDVVSLITTPSSLITTPSSLIARRPESLRLLRLEFALADALAAADRAEIPPVPEAALTHYAITRNHYRVRTHVLSAWQYEFLTTCSVEGIEVRQAVTTAAKACGLDPDPVWAGLFTWLPPAVDAGMVTVVRRP